MEITLLRCAYDYLAPDGSEIRLLLNLENRGGGLAHCTLHQGGVSVAQRHKTVGEIWYFLQGKGQVWRKREDKSRVDDLKPGHCLTIEAGTHFQFRNTGTEPLTFIITTIPRWPGPQDAVPVEGYWEPNQTERQSVSAWDIALHSSRLWM